MVRRLISELRDLERAAKGLEPGPAERRRLRKAVVASTERFLAQLDEVGAYVETDDKGIGLFDAPIRENGMPLDRVLAHLEHDVIRPGGQPAAPGYLAYIPGGGLYHSALGDYVAAVTNKYASVFFAGPGAVRMENMLLRWVADLVGYPASSGGNIASGGSIANLVAIATARDAHGVTGANVDTAVVYLTTQAHHCIEKALRLAGLAGVQVRHVPIDDRFRMVPDALAHAISADRARGLRPWMVVATAGTTDTGAIDPLEAIGDICARERCWFHVDAAYGGFFLLTADGRARMRGIERSDSVVLDPHKTLFLPYGSGIVVVRDAAPLETTHRYMGHYMQDAMREPGDTSPAEVSPELTKHFRALRMWLPLVLLGTAPFAAALEEKLLLARYFRQRVAALGFEIGPEPDLSVVTYRWAPDGMSLDAANACNQAIVDHVRRDGRVFLSSTMLDGVFTLRLVAVSFRTHRKTIDTALQALEEAKNSLQRDPTP